MARVKGKIQYPKKVDFRIEDELNDRLEYIIQKEGVKKGSWCRRAVEVRVESYFSDTDDSTNREEDYEQFKKARVEKATS